jgi:hypothetical protein
MTGSALQRDVAEHLGIASSADIKARCYGRRLRTRGELLPGWDECPVAWIVCA